MPSNVTLHLGDCLEYMRGMADKSVDAVITDPPYGDINHIDRLHERAKYAGGPIRKLHKENADDLTVDIDTVLEELLRVSKQWIYVFWGDKTGYVRSYFTQRDCMTRLGVWRKTNPTPLHAQLIWLSNLEPFAIARKRGAEFSGFYESPVIDAPIGSSKVHPTEKPLEVIVPMIEKSTTYGDTIFDPFMGSGTTGVAAVQLGRSFIGCEINPDYFVIAQKRIAEAQQQMVMPI